MDDTSQLKSEERPPLPFRRLLGLAVPEWRLLLAGMVCQALASAMVLAYPQVIKEVFDEALMERDLATVDLLALAMLGVLGVQAVSFGLRYYLFAVAGERVVARFRERVYECIMAQEIAFFDERRTGELTNRLSSDTTRLQSAVTSGLTALVRDASVAVGGIAIMFWESRALTLLMLAVVPPAVLVTFVFSRRIQRFSRRVQDALADAGNVAQETIAGIRTVRAFARERDALASYVRAVQNAFQLSRRHQANVALLVSASALTAFGSFAIVVWYGGRLVVTDQMTVGTLVSFVTYTMIVGFTLSMVGEGWTQVASARGAAENVFALIDRTPSIPAGGGLRVERVDGRIAFEGVHFTYPTRADVPVLHDITLTLEPGSAVALVGPSGSGKSTIAGLIPRFYDPVQGRVTLDGRDLRELDPIFLRQQIGIVAQEPILFSASIAENIRYGRADATESEVHAAARAAYADDFVREFPDGYDTEVGERGLQLSAGQKQRIAIARAVLKDPHILILDEATSALDAESEHLVKDALDRLMEGRTTLVIAHRLSTVRHADRVLVIERGRIAQTGTHDDLMHDTDGLYHRLVQKQFVQT